MAKRNKFDVDETLGASFNMNMLKRSFKYIWREKKKFLLALLFQMTAIVIWLAGPLLTSRAIDENIPQKDIKMLVINCILITVTIIIHSLLVAQANKQINIVGQRIIYDIRKDLFEHLQELSFTYYDTRPHGKILVRVINYVNSVANILSNGLLTVLLQIFNLGFIAMYMFILDVKLSFIVISGLPFVIIWIMIIKPIQRKAYQKYSNKSSNVNAYLNESITCMKITQLFTREKYNEDIFDNLIQESKEAWFKSVFTASTVHPVIDSISKVVIAILLYYGIFMANPIVSLGTLMAMMQYSNRFWNPIVQIANLYNNFINNMAYLERIFETIDEPVEVSDVEDAKEMPTIKGDVEFKNVTFEYEEGQPVLKNVSFTVKAGESVALVGPTGSGKSTIINLISRFYNVTDGQVLIDGQDISKVRLKSLRKQMGIMMQESFVFSDTIEANIRYGCLSADDEKVRKSAELVCANEFIEKLPDDYDTMLPERGSALSQGEKQLLSFARTVASSPKILILDEATSSIDTKTEKALQTGINEMMKGCTSFVVAHRLSTIRACDKIMYIKDGVIAECGKHDELMAKKGLYYNLSKNLKA